MNFIQRTKFRLFRYLTNSTSTTSGLTIDILLNCGIIFNEHLYIFSFDSFFRCNHLLFQTNSIAVLKRRSWIKYWLWMENVMFNRSILSWTKNVRLFFCGRFFIGKLNTMKKAKLMIMWRLTPPMSELILLNLTHTHTHKQVRIENQWNFSQWNIVTYLLCKKIHLNSTKILQTK